MILFTPVDTQEKSGWQFFDKNTGEWNAPDDRKRRRSRNSKSRKAAAKKNGRNRPSVLIVAATVRFPWLSCF